MEPEAIELSVDLTPHPDALARLITLLRRKGCVIQSLRFESSSARLMLTLVRGRSRHLVACLERDVTVLAVRVLEPTRSPGFAAPLTTDRLPDELCG